MQLDRIGSNIAMDMGTDLAQNSKAKPVKQETDKKTVEMFDMNKSDLGEYKKKVKDRNKDEIIDTIEDANEEFVAYDRKFEFSIHEKTKQITVKVLDSTTDEVIREIPPEKVLDMVAGIWEIAGLLVDQKI